MIDKSLKEYIVNNIFPIYSKNDVGHRINHIEYVIERSLKFASQVQPINYNMAYTIAAYHDIGHYIDPKNHERISADIMLYDENLREWFGEDEILIMFDAICDHRASLSEEPSSIYGKIVSSADRNVDMESILMRTYEYRRRNNPWMNTEQIMEESYEHVCSKFGPDGYAVDKMYFDDPEYEKFLRDAERMIKNKEKFKREFRRVNKL